MGAVEILYVYAFFGGLKRGLETRGLGGEGGFGGPENPGGGSSRTGGGGGGRDRGESTGNLGVGRGTRRLLP